MSFGTIPGSMSVAASSTGHLVTAGVAGGEGSGDSGTCHGH